MRGGTPPFLSVTVYPVIDQSIEIDIPEKDVRIDVYRASGAGGQHVNKTESAVRITHLPTGIAVASQTERSQHQNRAICWDMLKSKLYEIELEKKKAETGAFVGEKTEIGWGHQIRSYVLQPYQLVKDLRTGVESRTPAGRAGRRSRSLHGRGAGAGSRRQAERKDRRPRIGRHSTASALAEPYTGRAGTVRRLHRSQMGHHGDAHMNRSSSCRFRPVAAALVPWRPGPTVRASSSTSAARRQFRNHAGQPGRGPGAQSGVRDFGRTLVSDHSKARSEVLDVGRRFGMRPSREMAPEARDERDRLMGMRGRDFDREFVRYMIDDHRKDIGDFRDEAREHHGAVSDLAGRQLPTLREHLRMAMSLQR